MGAGVAADRAVPYWGLGPGAWLESRARGNNIFHASRARFEDSASRTATAEAAEAAAAALDDSVNLSKSF